MEASQAYTKQLIQSGYVRATSFAARGARQRGREILEVVNGPRGGRWIKFGRTKAQQAKDIKAGNV